MLYIAVRQPFPLGLHSLNCTTSVLFFYIATPPAAPHCITPQISCLVWTFSCCLTVMSVLLIASPHRTRAVGHLLQLWLAAAPVSFLLQLNTVIQSDGQFDCVSRLCYISLHLSRFCSVWRNMNSEAAKTSTVPNHFTFHVWIQINVCIWAVWFFHLQNSLVRVKSTALIPSTWLHYH